MIIHNKAQILKGVFGKSYEVGFDWLVFLFRYENRPVDDWHTERMALAGYAALNKYSRN